MITVFSSNREKKIWELEYRDPFKGLICYTHGWFFNTNQTKSSSVVKIKVTLIEHQIIEWQVWAIDNWKLLLIFDEWWHLYASDQTWFRGVMLITRVNGKESRDGSLFKCTTYVEKNIDIRTLVFNFERKIFLNLSAELETTCMAIEYLKQCFGTFR